MTQEEKQLLLQDICARLLYGVIIYRISDNSTHKFTCSDIAENIDMLSHFLECSEIYDIKPYLRPMSSMTEIEYMKLKAAYDNGSNGLFDEYSHIDWLNAHHFDYRGLIEKGLAIEAPKEMYKNY